MDHLTEDQIEDLARALDAIAVRVRRDLGQRDVDHLRRIVRVMRLSEATGRALLHFGIGPVTFALGAGALGVSKILENMEIGHNVMHGQYDWTHDPELDGRAYEWDLVCDGDHWRELHNHEHHTFTNVIGRDRDVGYGFLRVTAEQPWNPSHLAQPILAVGLALAFQWGVATHALHVPETLRGEQSLRELWARARPFLAKAARQVGKDYVFFPLLAGLAAPRVALGNAVANGIRNVWAFAIIFCGHFPEGVRAFHPEEIEGETRGRWYLRQILGSANIEGGRWLDLLSGHLSHQIEHHLFPDLPASRYPEIAGEVRAICARFGIPYQTGSLGRQIASVARQIVVHALPTRSLRRDAISSPGTARRSPARPIATQAA